MTVAPAFPVQTDPHLFRNLASAMPTAVFIITSSDASGRPVGATLSAVMPLSIDPLLMLASFDRKSSTLQSLREVGKPLVLNLLAADQLEEVKAFSSKADDKFAGLEWSVAPCGTRYLSRSVGAYFATVDALLPGGDHELIVARVHDIRRWEGRPAMAYLDRGFYSAADLGNAA